MSCAECVQQCDSFLETLRDKKGSGLTEFLLLALFVEFLVRRLEKPGNVLVCRKRFLELRKKHDRFIKTPGGKEIASLDEALQPALLRLLLARLLEQLLDVGFAG